MKVKVFEQEGVLCVVADSTEREAREAVQLALDAAFARVSISIDQDQPPRYQIEGTTTTGKITGLGRHLPAAREAALSGLERAGHEAISENPV
jgi:hypothetical protein